VETVSENAVVTWLVGLLGTEAGFDPEEAAAAAEACARGRGTFNVEAAATAATAAIATRRLPGGADWWRSEGQREKAALLRGDADTAAYQIAELVAEPAPDEWDPNWPENKQFRSIQLPAGAKVGDQFVVGNGEGHRGNFRVAEKDGALGAELLSDDWSLSAEWDDAWAHAETLRRCDD
jgi:hypothetical protein